MEYGTFVRKPFVVEAVQITKENIGELAVHIGSLSYNGNGDPFIIVDKRKVQNVFRVTPGYWMTRMHNTVRCYSDNAFRKEFIESSPELQAWVTYLSKETVS